MGADLLLKPSLRTYTVKTGHKVRASCAFFQGQADLQLEKVLVVVLSQGVKSLCVTIIMCIESKLRVEGVSCF